MNFRLAFILVVLVAVVGGYVALFELQKNPEREQQAPWLYDVGFDDLQGIRVRHRGDTQAFALQGDGRWVFEKTGEPVNYDRWSGIPVLLTGPRSTRQIPGSGNDPSEYGLADPRTVIDITLKSGQPIQVRLGGLTPDGSSVYAQVSGTPGVFLLPASWADVINRLVTEPPKVTPTPSPSPTATPTPAAVSLPSTSPA